MSLYQIVKSLVLLPTSLILPLIAGLLISMRWRRTGIAILTITTAAFYFCSTPYVSDRFVSWVQSVPALTNLDDARTAQAIVVLSADASATGPEYGGILLDGMTVMRLRYAAHLYRLTNVPILVSGGLIPGVPETLGGAMKTALEQDFGVPVAWVEGRSRDTRENAGYSAEMLHAAGVHKIVLVTDASHMPRALALFRATGLDVIAAPTSFTKTGHSLLRDLIPRMSTLETMHNALYEAMGSLWNRIRPPQPD